jgi:hypothetical protein
MNLKDLVLREQSVWNDEVACRASCRASGGSKGQIGRPSNKQDVNDLENGERLYSHDFPQFDVPHALFGIGRDWNVRLAQSEVIGL